MSPYWDGWQVDGMLALVLLAMAVYVWRLMGLVDGLSRQQERLSQSMAQMPTSMDVTDLRLQLTRLEGLIEGTSREAHTTRAAIRRVEDFLLKASRSDDSKF